MPNDRDPHPSLNPATESLPPAMPSAATAASDTPVTWALADGLGVYTASPGSPFLTAPLPLNGASGSPKSTANHVTERRGDQLGELRELLRRQVQGVPLRFKLSEDEISRLVTAMLDLIARHLRIGDDRAPHGHSPVGTP
jgi:hypothetical protein